MMFTIDFFQINRFSRNNAENSRGSNSIAVKNSNLMRDMEQKQTFPEIQKV